MEIIGYDEYGQRVYMKPGNGVETTYTYDENRRWLTAIQTHSSFRALQNMEYTFDRVGNILKLRDETDLARITQTDTYDSRYQLTRGEGTFEDIEHGYVEMRSSYTQQYSHDSTGNMRRKRSTNTITPASSMSSLNYDNEYSYYPDKPKQTERIGNMYYLYDGNGNIIEEREGGHSIEGIMGSVRELNRG